MICPNCKKEITNDSKFCEYCGLRIEENFEKFILSESVGTNDEKLPLFNLSDTITSADESKNCTENKKEKSLDKRISKWKEKLIDLTKRNRLLNFKSTKSSTLRIIDEQPPEVFRALVTNMSTMEFLPIISDILFVNVAYWKYSKTNNKPQNNKVKEIYVILTFSGGIFPVNITCVVCSNIPAVRTKIKIKNNISKKLRMNVFLPITPLNLKILFCIDKSSFSNSIFFLADW